MVIVRDLQDPLIKTPTVLTFGVYDGLHCGHQLIIRRVVERARAKEWTATVLTFDPHPRAVLRPESAPRLLQTIEQRRRAMQELGVEQLVLIPFTTALSKVSAEDFLSQTIFGRLDAREVYVGRGVAFGHNRGGGFDMLKATAERLGRIAEEVSEVLLHGWRISSTMIRRLLASGRVNLARRMLGRPYEISGVVEEGRKIGKATLNYPTANMKTAGFVVPATGVYVTYTRVGNELLQSVTNVGRRPTFGGDQEITIETHIFGFDREIYGERISIGFLHRLRGELKFESVDALRSQIERDARRAQLYFDKAPNLDSFAYLG
ncbi:MAG TPA: riboflavin biosynthesis protein RibF [Blastocatellia bacterium]|nr:riboflavin biosynthesis protein RibF [Blastocatellia bacterium]